jgi:hypothetical protein
VAKVAAAHRRHPRKVVDEAREAHAKGESLPSIAVRLNVPYPTVYGWFFMGRRIVEVSAFHPDERVREARRLFFVKGERAGSIATGLRASRNTVRNWLRGARADAGGPRAPTVKS